MASSAILFAIILLAIVAGTRGFIIESPRPIQPLTFPGAAGHPPPTNYRNQPIAGYPKVPPPNAHESGGNEQDLLPPLEDSQPGFRTFNLRRSIGDVKVDPKTGYPLVADESWKDAGGNEESLELPLDDPAEGGEEGAVDPKTGYPLFALPHWKDAGGDGDIIALPLGGNEENFGQKEEAVDPKTGYPLKANPQWKDAGGNGDILELPFEDLAERSDEKAVDPKTGYPLMAEEGWKDAGGDGDILELPLGESEPGVDPKTGYPLVAQPNWKDAGGDGNILELPLENSNEEPKLDPKTGYPLTAQPSWKDAGGDGDILQLPLQPSEEAVDPKTGYPLLAQPDWKDAGGNADILELPFEEPNRISTSQTQNWPGVDQYHVFEIFKLTELQPPSSVENFQNEFASRSIENTQGVGQNQKRSQTRINDRPIESTYTYTGPENVIVTVTRFKSERPNHQPNNQQNGFTQTRFGGDFREKQIDNFAGVPYFNQPVALQPIHQTFFKRHS